MPIITYWKGRINPRVSNALVCQMDLLVSIASLVGVEENATDSMNFKEVLFGESQKENLAESNPDKLKEMVDAFITIRVVKYSKD